MAWVKDLPSEARRDALQRIHAALLAMPPEPSVATACAFFGHRLFEAGLFDEAAELYDRCALISRDPEEKVMVLSAAGDVFRVLNRPGEAEARLTELARMLRAGEVPGLRSADLLLADALFKLGGLTDQRGDYERAAYLTEEGLERAGATLRSMDRLLFTMEAARRHARAGRPERGLELVARALAECPDCGTAAGDPTGRYPPGVRAAWLAERNQIAGFKPDDPRYSRNLEEVAADPRLNSVPENLGILNSLGYSYLAQERWDDALVVLQRNAAVFAPVATSPRASPTVVSNYLDGLLMLSQAHAGAGRLADAHAVLQSLVERFPDTDQARQAMAALGRAPTR